MVTIKENTVEFRFYRPTAKDVRLVGDFTGWRSGDIRMTRTEEGYWQAEISLKPGIFHFRYWADGQWYTDKTTVSIKDGPFGVDSVLWILPKVRIASGKGSSLSAQLSRGIDARIGLPAPQAVVTQAQMLASA